MRSVLLVDDEINVLRALQRALRHRFGGAALTVETFVDPELALLRLGETTFDVIVSDYRMSGVTPSGSWTSAGTELQSNMSSA